MSGSDVSDKAIPQRSGHGGGAAVDFQLAEEVPRMGAGGVNADTETASYFLGRQAFNQQLQQVEFTR